MRVIGSSVGPNSQHQVFYWAKCASLGLLLEQLRVYRLSQFLSSLVYRLSQFLSSLVYCLSQFLSSIVYYSFCLFIISIVYCLSWSIVVSLLTYDVPGWHKAASYPQIELWSKDCRMKLIYGLVFSHIDFCNALYAELPNIRLRSLQMIIVARL